ncbi:MAG: hypothetical protein Q8P30_00210 [Candidatus Uhrbacteria bacterium]|nr:hypothetical protein [Candidatus Uhrbacteria bacterium]
MSPVEISLNKGAKLDSFEVTFDVMRHGEKGPGDDQSALLTTHGFCQVESTVKGHLSGVQYDLAVVSDRQRTRQTVEHALGIMRQRHVEIIAPPSFAISPLLDPDSCPCPPEELWDYMESVKTVSDLLVASAPKTFRIARERLMNGINEICERFANLGEETREHRVLVGFHAPFAILATPNLEDPTWVGEADVIRYRVSMTDERVMNVLSAEHFYCPLT